MPDRVSDGRLNRSVGLSRFIYTNQEEPSMKTLQKLSSSTLLFAAVLCVSFLCNGCDAWDDPVENGNSLVIKGRFRSDLTGVVALDRLLFSLFPSVHALDPSTVAKVIVFREGGNHEISEVTDGRFAIGVETGAPVGLIFVGSSNNYLGYLSLRNGMDSLPLTQVAEDVTTIDLGTLTTSGQVVEPGHNPLGVELSLSAEEQTALAQGDDFFAAIVRNPDIDGNGTIDFLEGKFYRPFILYFVTGGSFGNAATPSVHTPARIDGHRFSVHINDNEGNLPMVVSFTGPQGSGLTNAVSDPSNSQSSTNKAYGAPFVTDPVVPLAGDYLVSYNNKRLTFRIADQTNAPSNILLAVPTLIFNNDQTLNRVNWVYKLGSGGDALEPSSVIESIELQISGMGAACASYPQQGRLYNSGMLPAQTTGHLLRCQNIQWQNVTGIAMAYNDVYGNHYVVSWYHSGQVE